MTKICFFDTHAHLDDARFQEDQALVIQRARDQGVDLIMNIGCDPESALRTMALIEAYDFVYGAVGLHPHDASLWTEAYSQSLACWSSHPKILALGEMGLDYHYDLSPRDVQRDVFRAQLRLAKSLKLPVVIHDREAHGDTMAILTEEGAWQNGGIFHCYSGSEEMAREIVKKGFYVSLSGSVTFKNAVKLKKVAEALPLDRLLIETDCPYLAPHPKRGKRNEPAYVVHTAAYIAQLRDLSLAEMARITWENGRRVYGLGQERVDG